jgi:outer membrane lipoprotein-sorting protein
MRVFGRKAVIAALLVGCALPAAAQIQGQGQVPSQVPLPAERPRTAPLVTGTTTPPPPVATQTAQAAPAPQPVQADPVKPNPFAALLGKTGATTALTADQRAIIDRVDNYLSSVQNLSGQFVQVGPDGKRTQGQFIIQKPGKVRFEYDPPSPIEIVADGQSVVVRDRSLATQDVYPLSQTPLRFLLANHVNLLKDTNLVAVYADDVFVTVVVEEKNAIVGTSRLMVMFSAKDMQLKQWTVTDPQGYDTTVAVYNLDTTAKADPGTFKIDYTRYSNGASNR